MATIPTAIAITREVRDGKVYLTTDHRGNRYTLSRGQWGWELWTRRLSLGSSNMGGFKRFDSLADVQAQCKAFAGVDLLSFF